MQKNSATSLSLVVLRVDQPIGEFYIGAIESGRLNRISRTDVRRLEEGVGDSYIGIQRILHLGRVKEISRYVNTDYATFPTSVVLAIDDRCVELRPIDLERDLFEMVISEYRDDELGVYIPLEGCAFVIDGQHRLAGLEKLEKGRKFEVNVSIFVGADVADQAEIFGTVNLAQTKVNRSLVYDLFSFARERSTEKVAHEITVALDRDKNGPFGNRIKRLGVATPGRDYETLSQANVVRGILRHMPGTPEEERSKGVKGLWSSEEPGESWRRRIFAPFYRAKNDVGIFMIMTNYFSAVRERWPSAWDNVEEGFILNRTNGFNALIRFLQDMYLFLAESPRVPEEVEVISVFKEFHLTADQFRSERFLPGSSGASQLYKELLQELSRVGAN